MNMPSPALTPCASPHSFQTVGRPRRVSLLSSMSSWISEKSWISWIPAASGMRLARIAAGRAAGQQRQLRAQQLTRIHLGRRQLFIAPAQLVFLHGVELRDALLGLRKSVAHRRLN